MPGYSIIARTSGTPPVGTIVPSDMAQPEDVTVIPLSAPGYDPGEFPDLVAFLHRWGYTAGHLPPDGSSLQSRGLV